MDGFTIEGWVQAGDEAAGAVHPLVVWNGAFALWSDANGDGHFTDSSTEQIGADATSGWMDGEIHHVAGTYANGTASLFLDGKRLAFNTSSAMGTSPTSSIDIGCWSALGFHHEGIIDEVRLSSTVRYQEDFTPELSTFVFDSQTIHLWHFDEGKDDFALDEAQLADGYLNQAEWTEFSISGDDTAAR